MKCKHYKFRLPAYMHSFIHCCVHCCVVHNGVIECMFPCNWDNASKRCKYYEVEKHYTYRLAVRDYVRDATYYISTEFNSEKEARDAMPSWMSNVEIVKYREVAQP